MLFVLFFDFDFQSKSTTLGIKSKLFLLSLIVDFPVQHKLLCLFVVHVEEALLLVQASDGLHVAVGEGEVEDPGILHNVLRIARAGDDGETFLQVPAEDNLCGRLVLHRKPVTILIIITGLRSLFTEKCISLLPEVGW